MFREEVASAELVQKVEDRLNAIAYSLLGPISFTSLGLHVSFEPLAGPGASAAWRAPSASRRTSR